MRQGAEATIPWIRVSCRVPLAVSISFKDNHNINRIPQAKKYKFADLVLSSMIIVCHLIII